MQWISLFDPRTGARFSENQTAPKLENRKTSPCSPRAPNILHVLPSRMVGWNELCNPDPAVALFLLSEYRSYLLYWLFLLFFLITHQRLIQSALFICNHDPLPATIIQGSEINSKIYMAYPFS